jgi:hypothetical protein
MRLIDSAGREVEASIRLVKADKMPLKKDGWNFNWRDLAKDKKKKFFGLIAEGNVEGMLSIEIQDAGGDKVLFMTHVEIASHNIGKKGKYKDSAGCLLAWACYQSILELENGNPYSGFVAFESKTELIDHYISYGATLAMKNKMFFDSKVGDVLIKRYLKDK